MVVYVPSVNCKNQLHGGLKRLFIMMVFPVSPLKSQFGKMYVVMSEIYGISICGLCSSDVDDRFSRIDFRL